MPRGNEGRLLHLFHYFGKIIDLLKVQHILRNNLVIGINKLGSKEIYKVLISTSFVKPLTQNYDEERFSLTISEQTLSYFLSGLATGDTCLQNLSV